MTHESPNFEQPMAESTPLQELSAVTEKQELTPEEVVLLSGAAIEAIGGTSLKEKITAENFQEVLERSILEGVHNLPEFLAGELETVDAKLLNQRADDLLKDIEREKDLHEIAELQAKLIFQYIGIISRVQNDGEGFTPLVAKEVIGIDCSLSVWALKEKLQNTETDFEFGYLPGHVVGFVKLADGRQLYVDPQSGIIEEVNLESAVKNSEDKMAYEVFEITSEKRIMGQLPNEKPTSRTNEKGSDYTPKWVGKSKNGLLNTLGFMNMLANPTCSAFYTEAGKVFRKGIDMPEMEPTLYEASEKAIQTWRADNAEDDQIKKYFIQEMGDNLPQVMAYKEKGESCYVKFQALVDKITDGKTMNDDENEFSILERKHQTDWENAERAMREAED